MSEYLYKNNQQAEAICAFTSKLINKKVSREEVLTILTTCEKAMPHDFVTAIDLLVDKQAVSTEMKKGINKMLNVFYTHLNELPQPKLTSNSFVQLLVDDNKAILENTVLLKPAIKEAQKIDNPGVQFLSGFNNQLTILSKIEQHFLITENILFPFLEKQWPDHKCFQVLWSVHDDVRNGLRELQKLIDSKDWDLKRFNRLAGDLFFNIRTIIFREEKIIIPALVEAGLAMTLDDHLQEANEIGWSFVDSPVMDIKENSEKRKSGNIGSSVNFATGSLSPQQIELIFNHLPVDITFVDEEDTVRYFSTPKKRTFTRTNAVIGRKVQNCHPPESVWMVEEILAAFRKGEQEDASFWIPFGDQFVYIQYFALRDAGGDYSGTIEVTQDVKEIRGLEGERRLLNWEKS